MLQISFNEDSQTYYITYGGLDLFILMDKLNLLQTFKEIVEKHDGELSKQGEDFFIESSAFDALEEIEMFFVKDDFLSRKIAEIFQNYSDIKSLNNYLTMFTEVDLNQILKKNLP